MDGSVVCFCYDYRHCPPRFVPIDVLPPPTSCAVKLFSAYALSSTCTPSDMSPPFYLPPSDTTNLAITSSGQEHRGRAAGSRTTTGCSRLHQHRPAAETTSQPRSQNNEQERPVAGAARREGDEQERPETMKMSRSHQWRKRRAVMRIR